MCSELDVKPNQFIEEVVLIAIELLGVKRSRELMHLYDPDEIPSDGDGPIQTVLPDDLKKRYARLIAGKARIPFEYEERKKRCGNWR